MKRDQNTQKTCKINLCLNSALTEWFVKSVTISHLAFPKFRNHCDVAVVSFTVVAEVSGTGQQC